MNRSNRMQGITAALVSALFLGLAPVFGRQAILLGMPPLAVVAIRTTLAALLLLTVMVIAYRPYLYIYPAGLLGCLLAGWINGVGSLFYYSALGRINAGLGQMLYSLYPLFLVLWMALDNQPPTRLTIFRLILAIPAVLLLIQVSAGQVDMIGVAEMLIAAALYALHIPFNQRVLYDMPPQTVTLYTLLAMSAVTLPTFLFSGSLSALAPAGQSIPSLGQVEQYWWPVLGLTFVTFFSRLTLFVSVKHLGGMQTALLGLGEVLVTVFFAHFWLHENFTTSQWIGAIILLLSLLLVAFEKPAPRRVQGGGFLSWLHATGIPPESFPPPDS
jgi:drug/metabolite transporter (DMT)-like permease